jgi:hypothetical protein
MEVTMNAEKVRQEIEKLIVKEKAWRQYPASKAQIARLAELGLVELMPRQAKGGVIGHTDAARVIEAAEDAGGYRVHGDEGFHEAPSALWVALHEDDEAAANEEDEPEAEKIASYEIDDQVYVIYRRHGVYEVDAEWSDGPAAVFDHLPTEDEVKAIHSDYLNAKRAEHEYDALMDEIAAEEQRRFELSAAEEEEVAMRLDELHPLSYFESLGLAKAATLRRAAIERRLRAEKIGRDWFTSERDVLAFLKRCEFRSKIAVVPVVRLISFDEAQRRFEAGLPVAWYRQWDEEYLSGATVWYSQVGLNVPNIIRLGWKPLAFPTRERLDGWEVMRSAPVPYVRGWWFGIPDPQWLREMKEMKD